MRTIVRGDVNGNLAVAMLVACGASGGLGCVEAASESVKQSAIGECETEWVCGSNSPQIDHYGFHELHLEGEVNRERFSLATTGGQAKIIKGGQRYTLKVVDSRIYGVDGSGGASISGTALIGAEIVVLYRGRPEYSIRIDGVREISYAVEPTGSKLEAYNLSWFNQKNPIDSKRSICATPVILPEPSMFSELGQVDASAVRRGPGGDEMLGMRAGETVVFEGDRFDAASMTMAKDAMALWINFGCAGHTLAKMHLTRNTIASGAEAYGAKHHERQATLKMLVADYCGDGTPFTVAGEQLRWMGGLVGYYTRPQTLEARWDSKGAVCLNDPRLRRTTSALAVQLFGNDIDAAIASQCAIPQCGNPDVLQLDGQPRISGNP